MTVMAMNYVVNPFTTFGRKFMQSCEVIGYSRAASHLSQMGYYKEAKKCMLMAAEIRK